MKILHLIQKPQFRGAEIFTCQLASHQKEKGHKVIIAAVFQGEGELPWEDEIYSLNGNQQARFLDFQAWKKLRALIKDFQPDIVQANAGDTLKYAVLSKLRYGWKSTIVFRNASQVGRYLKSGFQKRLNNFFYDYVDGVASVSRASEFDLLKVFPNVRGKTKVIPIGIEDSDDLEEIVFLPKEAQHIVHVGGFTFEKNHRELLSIFQAIHQKLPDTHLHLVGDGPLRKEIEREVQSLGLEKEVTFYGFVDNPLAYIRGAELLVLPSIIEGLPGVLLEAMYCKTPVVAYNVGGISELVTQDTGSLIQAGESALFANTCCDVLKNGRENQVDFAYAYVQKHFMNEQLTEEFIRFYEDIIEQKRMK